MRVKRDKQENAWGEPDAPGQQTSATKDYEAPLFVVGMPRSGTTLVSTLLNERSHICIAPETHFFSRHFHQLRKQKLTPIDALAALRNSNEYEDFGFTNTETIDLFAACERLNDTAQIFPALCKAYAARRSEPIWGEKTPAHLEHIATLCAVAPDARFVCMTRDPRDISLSLKKVPWNNDDVLEHIFRWRKYQRLAAYWQRQLGSRFQIIRYEDLVANPDACIGNLCTVLGLPRRETHHNNHTQVLNFNREREYWKDRAAQPPDTKSAGRWRKEMAAAEQILFSTLCGDALARSGYDAAKSEQPFIQKTGQRTQFWATILYRRIKRRLPTSAPLPTAEAKRNAPPITVLARPAWSGAKTNPYHYLLYSALQRQNCQIREHSVRRALFDKADIVHVHWPETVLSNATFSNKLKRWLLHLVLNRIQALRGAKIVWTVHNLKPHEPGNDSFSRWVWSQFLRRVDAAIHLSHAAKRLAEETYTELSGKPSFVIPHGHYEDVYNFPIDKDEARLSLGVAPTARTILYFGQVRPYKNVNQLITAFKALENPNAVLRIAGRPHPQAKHLGVELETLAAGDSRIQCQWDFLPQDELAKQIKAADLIVLPFKQILNSGSVLLALSGGGVVLAPKAGSLQELQNIVGSEHLHLYEGDLSPDILRLALEQSKRDGCGTPLSNIAALGWDAIAAKTAHVYRQIRTEG